MEENSIALEQGSERAMAKGFCLTSNMIVIKMVMIIVKIVLPFVPFSFFMEVVSPFLLGVK